MSLPENTAAQIVIDALEDISVRMDETTLGASDERSGVRTINQIMARFTADGVDLGFTVLTAGTDIVTINNGAIDALTSILALRLWPKYRTPDPPFTIVNNAKKGEELIYRLGLTIRPSAYPNTLPRGSGNAPLREQPGDTFYPLFDASEWLLSDGAWDDTGIWDDDATWSD